MRIIKDGELAMKVKLAHNEGLDNIYKCKICGHFICWCCNDGSCDTLIYTDDGKDCDVCPCMNKGCEVEID